MKFSRLIRWQLLSLLAAGAMVMAACDQGGSQSSAATPTSASQTIATQPVATIPPTSPPATPAALPTATAAPILPAGDPNEALVQAFQRLDTAYPYRLTENTSGGGLTFERVLEMAAADRYHTTWTTEPSGGPGEVIQLGDTIYWNINGQWTELTEAPSEAESQVDMDALLEQGLKNVQLVGPEAVNGVDALAYTFEFEFDIFDGAGTVWIGTADGLPHQVDLQGTMSGFPIQTKLVYEYGIEVTIEPPIP